MLFFAMLSSCSMLISCSEHCYLMLFSAMSSSSPSLWSCYLLHFLPCLFELDMLWTSRSSVFIFCQASPVDYCHVLVAMLGCCSIVVCCILSAILLFIADSCHSCFACHLQTVHPIPVIFISISTEITSSFQWHAWFVMNCSVVSASNSQIGLHIIVSAMLCFLPSLKPDNETCYVYMLAIISSGPFWLMVSQGLLLCAFSRTLLCLVLLC